MNGDETPRPRSSSSLSRALPLLSLLSQRTPDPVLVPHPTPSSSLEWTGCGTSGCGGSEEKKVSVVEERGRGEKGDFGREGVWECRGIEAGGGGLRGEK